MERPLRLAAAAALLASAVSSLSAQAPETGFLDRHVTIAGRSYHYQVYVPDAYSTSRPWPVILFLHGAGERGADGLLETQVGLGAAVRQHADRFPALIVFPQAPAESAWTGTPARVAMAALDRTIREFRADTARLYLTGLSMGGNGAWYLAYRFPSRFAGLLVICGWVTPFSDEFRPFEPVVPSEGGLPFDSLARRLRRTPTWIVHGETDDVVPVEQSRRAAAAFRAAGAPIRYLELPGTGHDAWDAAYGSPTIIEWLLSQRRPPGAASR